MSDTPADRLQVIQSELTQLLQERLATLDSALRDSETTTRRIVRAEVEIDRYTSSSERLRDELSTLKAQTTQMRAEQEDMESQRAALARQGRAAWRGRSRWAPVRRDRVAAAGGAPPF